MSAARCRICGGGLRPRFTLPVLDGRHVADYRECTACGALLVVNPHWLKQAYAGEAQPRPDNPDPGRLRRNFSALRYLLALRAAGLTTSRVLDFGGGYGLLAQMLLDSGVDAWTMDEHVPEPYFATGRALPTDGAPIGGFDVVTALEVVEHLVDPMDVGARLRRLIAPGGSLVLSTTLYRGDVHGPDWPYLAARWGQHVTLWSEASLAHYASVLGYRSLGYFPGGDGFLVIVSTQEPELLGALLERAVDLLDRTELLDPVLSRWDLRSDFVVATAPRVTSPRAAPTAR